VLPDVTEVSHYLKLSRSNKSYLMGVHKNRYTGAGMELEYLREYTPDDEFRRIDWKASTRAMKPLTREYQIERSNTILFMLDCGRMMASEQNFLNHLDHAINGLLLLSYIALKRGDSVGVIAYSDHIVGELPPVKGKSAIKKLTSFCASLEPEYVESNFAIASARTRALLSKRSLIIVCSDAESDMNYLQYRKYYRLLKKRHLPVFFLLRDQLLEDTLQNNPRYLSDLYTQAAAKDMYMNRKRVIAKLKQTGIPVFDILPPQIGSRVVEKYLELLSRNQL
jgi:uncharacterized protein (DUF58 family)